jgi:hypothetical protein
MSRTVYFTGKAPDTVFRIGNIRLFILFIPANYIKKTGINTCLAMGTLFQVNFDFFCRHIVPPRLFIAFIRKVLTI